MNRIRLWITAKTYRVVIATALATLALVGVSKAIARTYAAFVLLHEIDRRQQNDAKRLDDVIAYLNNQIASATPKKD